MMKCKNADEIQRGYCLHKRVKCNGDCDFSFDDKTIIIEPTELCSESSIFGNYYIGLSDKDIDALINGKILGMTHEEYNIFLKKV